MRFFEYSANRFALRLRSSLLKNCITDIDTCINILLKSFEAYKNYKYEVKFNKIVPNENTHLYLNNFDTPCTKQEFIDEFNKENFDLLDDTASDFPKLCLDEFMKLFNDKGWLIINNEEEQKKFNTMEKDESYLNENLAIYKKVYQKFNEEVIGLDSIIAYHSDKDLDFIKYINRNIYRGKRGAYGEGVYFNINFEDCVNNESRATYGNYIFKCEVINLQNFFIYNYNVYNDIYGTNYSTKQEILNVQKEKFGFDKIPESIREINKNENLKEYKKFFESINGIIYYDRDDGLCLVSFVPSLVNIISWSHDDGKTWNKVENKKSFFAKRRRHLFKGSNIRKYHLERYSHGVHFDDDLS